MIVEGAVAVEQLARSQYPVRSVLVLPTQVDRVPAGIDAPVYVAPRDVLTATVGFNLHRGVVASADRIPLPSPADVCRDARTVLVLEDLNDHENLGAMFRNAAAFGVDAVLLTPRCADPLYRRSVRVSLGHALRVPFARVDAVPRRPRVGLHRRWRSRRTRLLGRSTRRGRTGSRCFSALRVRGCPPKRWQRPTTASGSRWRLGSTR